MSALPVLRPFPAVTYPLDGLEMEAAFLGVPAGTAGDDHLIADSQGRFRDAVACQAVGFDHSAANTCSSPRSSRVLTFSHAWGAR